MVGRKKKEIQSGGEKMRNASAQQGASSKAQGPEEICLSLEHQSPSKTSEKMGYFDRVTVSLHIL